MKTVSGGRPGLFATCLWLSVVAASIVACGGGGDDGSSPTHYALSGSVSGLTADGLLLANADTTLTVPANASSFSFGAVLAAGSTYNITVSAQPVGEICTVANGSGVTGTSDVTTPLVNCAPPLTKVWTWVSGSKFANALGIYGTLGVGSPTTVPGARSRASSWTDADGSLWLFGGTGYASSFDTQDVLNDLWMFSPKSGNWTWMGGSNVWRAPGVYGTRGVASASNVPGARTCASSWADPDGNLWLFGGSGFDSAGTRGELNDLWKYNLGTRNWTWVSGSDVVYAVGIYGTQGVASPDNVPGARWCASSSIDADGNLWLFGGSGRNDLWKYDLGTGNWTWVNGSDVSNAVGVYGTQGIASAENVPGARTSPAFWIDSSGNIWLFGGHRNSPGDMGALNDLWTYSPRTGTWTWVGGSNEIDAPGIYGIQGTASAGNMPGAREEAASWADSSGDLWLFGGRGVDAHGGHSHLNDRWKYSPSTGHWTWVDGSMGIGMLAGVYGIQGIASASNVPGARAAATSWIDSSGNVFLFGGDTRYLFIEPPPSPGRVPHFVSGSLNDLWEYSP